MLLNAEIIPDAIPAFWIVVAEARNDDTIPRHQSIHGRLPYAVVSDRAMDQKDWRPMSFISEGQGVAINKHPLDVCGNWPMRNHRLPLHLDRKRGASR